MCGCLTKHWVVFIGCVYWEFIEIMFIRIGWGETLSSRNMDIMICSKICVCHICQERLQFHSLFFWAPPVLVLTDGMNSNSIELECNLVHCSPFFGWLLSLFVVGSAILGPTIFPQFLCATDAPLEFKYSLYAHITRAKQSSC